jgi:hypothetical protein
MNSIEKYSDSCEVVELILFEEIVDIYTCHRHFTCLGVV